MKLTEHEMRGVIKGQALPADIRVGESVPAYLVRKFDELYAKLETATSLAGIAGDLNTVVQEGFAEVVAERDALQEQVQKLAGENSALKEWADVRAKSDDAREQENYSTLKIDWRQRSLADMETTETDAVIREIGAKAVDKVLKDYSAHAVTAGLMTDDLVTVSEAIQALEHCAANIRAGEVS